MIDLLTMPTSIAILTSGVIFYVLGRWSGFASGAKTTAAITIDSLIEQGYLRWQKHDNGEIEIKKLEDD